MQELFPLFKLFLIYPCQERKPAQSNLLHTQRPLKNISDTNISCSTRRSHYTLPQDRSRYPWNQPDPLPSNMLSVTDVPSSTVDLPICLDNTSVPDWFVQFQANLFQKRECQFHELAQLSSVLEERVNTLNWSTKRTTRRTSTRCTSTTLTSSDKAAHHSGRHTCRVTYI